MVEFFDGAIFCCSLCKKRKFKNLKNLNIHLAVKHHTKYKIEIVDGTARPISRLKVVRYRTKLAKYPYY